MKALTLPAVSVLLSLLPTSLQALGESWCVISCKAGVRVGIFCCLACSSGSKASLQLPHPAGCIPSDWSGPWELKRKADRDAGSLPKRGEASGWGKAGSQDRGMDADKVLLWGLT